MVEKQKQLMAPSVKDCINYIPAKQKQLWTPSVNEDILEKEKQPKALTTEGNIPEKQS